MDAKHPSTVGLMSEFIPNNMERTIIFLDFDAYRVQVEGLEHWNLGRSITEHRPIIVVSNKGNRLICVNYAARRLGIKGPNEESRNVRELEKQYGSHGLVIHKPKLRWEREDNFTPEVYMSKVMKVLERYRTGLKNPDAVIIERNYLDGIYMDVTELVRQRCGGKYLKGPLPSRLGVLTSSTKKEGTPVAVFEDVDRAKSGSDLQSNILEWSVGQHQDTQEYMELVHGGCIAMAVIRMMLKETNLQASAGVSGTKILARLARDRAKPEGVTMLPYNALPRLSHQFKITQIYGYGGIKGRWLRQIARESYKRKLETFADVLAWREGYSALRFLCNSLTTLNAKLKRKVENMTPEAQRILRACHGNDGDEEVKPLIQFKKAMETSAQFTGGETYGQFKAQIRNLSHDFAHRLQFYTQEWNWMPQQVTASVKWVGDAQEGCIPATKMKWNDPDWVYIQDFILNIIMREIRINQFYKQGLWNYQQVSAVHLKARYNSQ